MNKNTTENCFCYIILFVLIFSVLPLHTKASSDRLQKVTYNDQTSESVIINEIMVSNIDMFLDRSYDFGGYVELYNPTDRPVRLFNMYISDDANNLLKYRLKAIAGSIPAKGFVNVWFDHNGLEGDFMDGAMAQVPWKLNFDGGELFISNQFGEMITSISYPEGISRVSYARKVDGGNEWGYTSTPSPEATNTGSEFCIQRLDPPSPDIEGSLFIDPFTLYVGFTEGTTLRYTTDGSTPTLTNGNTSVSGAFRVKAGSSYIYRFRSFKEGYLPSSVVTRSFIYRDKNYTLPIASIVTSPDNLYNDTIGILVSGKYNNYNKDWDRPINFELIDQNNNSCLNQECDMAISGAYSRGFDPRPFRLKSSKQYDGQSTFDYPVFDLKKYNKQRSIKFRNGGNDVATRLKDAALQQIILSSGMYIDGQLWEPAHVFLNGRYHGMLNMREPSNKFYAYSNYGLDEDNLDVFEINPTFGYVQKEGDNNLYLRWHFLSANAIDDDVYSEICKIIDIDEFTNYMAAECWLGSNDWIANSNNLKAFRDHSETKNDKGKFHFVMYDIDAAFATDNLFNDIITKAADEGLSQKYGVAQIFLNMLKNETFKTKFATAYCIVSGSVFEPNRSTTIINEMMDTIRPALALENLSPDSKGDEIKKAITSLTRRASRMTALSNFLSLKQGRVLALSSNIPQARFLINGEPVPTNKFNGTIYGNPTLEVSAPAGYNFVCWRRASDNTVLSTDRKYVFDKIIGTTLVAEFETLSLDNLLNAGAAPVVINEISASNEIFSNDYYKRNDWIELYNNTSEDINVAGMYLSDDTKNLYKYQIESNEKVNTIILANGYLVVWCDKLTPLTALHTPFKLSNENQSCICITPPDGSWHDNFFYDTHEGTRSIGRYPDGGKRIYNMVKPTIGGANFISSQAVYMRGMDSNYIPGVSTNIDGVIVSDKAIRYYSPSGILLNEPMKGMNIAVDAKGNTKMILIK